MRTLILIFLLLAFSCKKDDCWLCVTDTVSYIGNIQIRESSIRKEVCDKTPDEIITYEKLNSKTIYTKEGNFTVKTESNCKCIR